MATFIKPYLVEGHSDGDQPSEATWKEVFRDVLPRRDETLLLLLGRDDTAYFADLNDPRFIVLHTIEKTERTDRTIERLTQGVVQGFDRAWLPTDFLFGLRRGPLRGFKFGHQTSLSGVIRLEPESEIFVEDHGRDPVEEDELDEQTVDDAGTRRRRGSLPISKLAVSNTLTAEADYENLRTTRIFHGRQALDSVEFVSGDRRGRVVTDLYSSGKLVGSGTSAALHLVIVDEIRIAYSRAVTLIEQDYALGWVASGDAIVYQGEPLTFLFPADMVINLYDFVTSMFVAFKPFKLFGIPHSVTDNRIDVEAIDLHTNDPLAFEITHSWMRVYLPRGSCGNIIARLYTNLLHAAHSGILLENGSGEPLFTEATARVE